MGDTVLATALPRADMLNLVQFLTRTNVAPKGYKVIWDGEPWTFMGANNGRPGAFIEISISNFRSMGVDDYRQEFDEATLTMTSVLCGVRQFTLTLDCRSYDGNIPSFDILEVIRLRLNNPRNVTAKKQLQSVGLSVAKVHPMVELPEKTDQRFVWRTSLDVVFNWASNDVTGDDGGEIIATVGTVAGTPNPISPVGTNVITGTFDPAGSSGDGD